MPGEDSAHLNYLSSQIIEKAWGKCHRLISTPQLRIENIAIVPGGYSSIHCHHRQFNQFHLLTGKMTIRVFPLPLILEVLGISKGRALSQSLKHGPSILAGIDLLEMAASNAYPINAAKLDGKGCSFTLEAGDCLNVAPGYWHQFQVGKEGANAVEIYTSIAAPEIDLGVMPQAADMIGHLIHCAGGVSPDDIFRISQNGVSQI